MSLFDLAGRCALITGGNGGIGLGIAKGLAGAGAQVLIAGRDRAKNAAALAELIAGGGEAQAIEVDVTTEGFAEAMLAEAEARLGGIDILVNNAGISIAKRPEELTEADWRSVIDTNLTSVFLASKAAYPGFKARGGGKIINIGSMYSLFGAWYSAAYSASKGGVVQITKSLATAWAEDNIQVNAILPGWIDTAMTARIRARLEGFDKAIAQRTPAGRWGTPDDFAGTAVFLAGHASDFVTGAQIVVDGGYAVQGSV
ncbi:MAG TPA: glucose 1-dehydrogenase [Caulobacteraceae bacterium]|jgi:2-deoxy-D-gluconate 3-dehydrogenase